MDSKHKTRGNNWTTRVQMLQKYLHLKHIFQIKRDLILIVLCVLNL